MQLGSVWAEWAPIWCAGSSSRATSAKTRASSYGGDPRRRRPFLIALAQADAGGYDARLF